MFQASNLKEKGFTLTELLVSIFIIAILSAIALANYRTGQEKLILERAATKLAQDIRRVQEMAMSAQEFGGQVPDGYGISLDKVPPPQKSYILFTDDNANQHYDAGSDGKIEEITFEERIKIKNLGMGINHLHVIFRPPDPKVYFYDGTNFLSSTETTITICLEDDETKEKNIKINKAGLINVVD